MEKKINAVLKDFAKIRSSWKDGRNYPRNAMIYYIYREALLVKRKGRQLNEGLYKLK